MKGAEKTPNTGARFLDTVNVAGLSMVVDGEAGAGRGASPVTPASFVTPASRMAEPLAFEAVLDTSGVSVDTAQFFINAKHYVEDDPDISTKVNGVFQFIIKRGGGDWTIDLTRGQPGRVVRARARNPNSTLIYSSEEVFHRLNSNRTSVHKELLLGRFKVSGDLALLGKMQAVFKEAAAKRAAAVAREHARQADMQHRLRQPSYMSKADPAAGAGASSNAKAPAWIPDHEVSRCIKCQAAFSFLRRRHHCRACGRIFCADCSGDTYKGNRVCDWCSSKLQGPRSRRPSVAVTDTAGTESVQAASPSTPPRLPPVAEALSEAGALSASESGALSEYNASAGGDELVEEESVMETRVKQLEETVVTLRRELVATSSMNQQPVAPFQVISANPLLLVLTLSFMTLVSAFTWKLLLFALTVHTLWGLAAGTLWFGAYSAALNLGFVVVFTVVATSKSFTMLRRRLEFFALGFSVWLDYRIVKHQTSGMEDSESQPIWDVAHVRNGIRVQQYCMNAQGLYIKLGQYLSTRTDMVPPPYIDILTKLQDGARSQDIAVVRQIIEEDLKKPCADIFRELNDKPLATASIGQVHKGCLHDGTVVAVKVQHKGVAELLTMDMNTMGMFLTIITTFDKTIDFKPFVDEWSKEVQKELSFVHEAENTTEVAQHLRKSGLAVVVPRIIPGMFSDRVMAMEFINGEKVSDVTTLRGLGVNVDQFVATVCESLAYQMYVAGLFNGDPHPGNIMLAQKRYLNLPDPVPGVPDPFSALDETDWIPVLIDFGLTKRLTDTLRLSFARFVVSGETLDYGGIMEAHKEMGLKLSTENMKTDLLNASYTFRRAAPASAARERFKDHQTKLAQRDKSRKIVGSWPKELVFHFRAIELVQGLCSRLETSHHVVSSLSKMARLALVRRFAPEDREHPPIYPTLSPPLPDLHAVVAGVVDASLKAGSMLGVQVSAVRGGAVVLDFAAGSMGQLDPRAVRPSTLFPCFGVSRLAPAAAMHSLVASKQAAFTETVATYWPEFSSHGKDACSIAELMRCRSGVEAALPEYMATTQCSVDTLEDNWAFVCDQEPLLLPPVQHTRPDVVESLLPPTNMCGPEPPQEAIAHLLYGWGWAISALITRLSGKAVRECIRAHVSSKLNLEAEFMLGIPEDDTAAARVATVELSVMDCTDREETADSVASPTRRGPASVSSGAPSEAKGEEESPMAAATAAMSDTTLATTLAAMELGAVMGEGGMKDLKELTRGGIEHLMDPRVLNNSNMKHGLLPQANLFASARALARVLAGVGEDVYKANMGDATPAVAAVHAACRDLGFRPFVLQAPGEAPTVGFGISAIGGTTVLYVPEAHTAVAVTVNQLLPSRAASIDVLSAVCKQLGLGEPLNP